MPKGKVTLVGAGPGDPGLLTVKGLQMLERADVVVYDRLVGEEILSLIPPGTKRIDVGKASGRHPVPQERINRILAEEARQGRHVVRLKGGDPFLFGRGVEEIEALTACGIPFQEVPGVTSAIAAPAYAGIPVTRRDLCSSVHIITGHAKNGGLSHIDFDSLSRLSGTLVFLMGVKSLRSISVGLLRAGMAPETPAAVVENGTTPRQRKILSTVASLPEKAEAADIQSPAVIVVGEVCSFSDRMDWFGKLPLFGVRVLVTRPSEAGGRLGRLLRELGADVTAAPCISTEPVAPNHQLDEAIQGLYAWSWLAFTSGFGVRTFFDRLHELGRDTRVLGRLRVAAVGPGTAQALMEKGIRADLVPDTYAGGELAGALLERMKPGERVLICRAKKAGQRLTDTLRQAGAAYDDLPVYETKPICPDFDLSSRVASGAFDYVAFTSASTVEGFVKALEPGTDLSRVKGLCIGPSAAEKAMEHGIPAVCSRRADIDSVAEALLELEAGRAAEE